MKFKLVYTFGLLFVSGNAAFASDGADKIPAPTVEMRAAGAQPTPVAVVDSSQIPAPKVEIVPQSQASASYDNYRVDASGNSQYDEQYSEAGERAAPTVTLVR